MVNYFHDLHRGVTDGAAGTPVLVSSVKWEYQYTTKDADETRE